MGTVSPPPQPKYRLHFQSNILISLGILTVAQSSLDPSVDQDADQIDSLYLRP